METLIIGKKFYSIPLERAENILGEMRSEFEKKYGGYAVLGSMGPSKEERKMLGVYMDTLVALGLTDAVLDEKKKLGSTEITLSYMIDLMKEEITDLLARPEGWG